MNRYSYVIRSRLCVQKFGYLINVKHISRVTVGQKSGRLIVSCLAGVKVGDLTCGTPDDLGFGAKGVMITGFAFEP